MKGLYDVNTGKFFGINNCDLVVLENVLILGKTEVELKVKKLKNCKEAVKDEVIRKMIKNEGE